MTVMFLIAMRSSKHDLQVKTIQRDLFVFVYLTPHQALLFLAVRPGQSEMKAWEILFSGSSKATVYSECCTFEIAV